MPKVFQHFIFQLAQDMCTTSKNAYTVLSFPSFTHIKQTVISVVNITYLPKQFNQRKSPAAISIYLKC